MKKRIRLSKRIRQFVRGVLPFEDELELLTEIVESEKWLNNLELELMIHQMAIKKQESEKHNLQFLY